MAVFSVGASFWMIEGDSSFISSNLEQREPGLQLVAGDAQFCIKGTDDVIYKWKRIEDSELNDLSDVNAGSPITNQVLKWDGVEWVPGTFSVSISGTPNYIAMFDGAGTDVTDTFISSNSTTMFISDNKLIGFGNTISSPNCSVYCDGTDTFIENNNGSTKFILDTADHTDALDIYQGTDSYLRVDTTNSVLELALGAGIDKVKINQKIQIGTNLINYAGGTTYGFSFDNLNTVTMTSQPSTWGDAKMNLTINEKTAFAQYCGAGLVLGGTYNAAQDLVGYGMIKGAKETAVDGNTDGQLHFQTKSHGSAPTTHMYIDSTGGLFLLNLKSGATQVAAGAAANEVWVTSGHATQEDNTLMIGV